MPLALILGRLKQAEPDHEDASLALGHLASDLELPTSNRYQVYGTLTQWFSQHGLQVGRQDSLGNLVSMEVYLGADILLAPWYAPNGPLPNLLYKLYT